MFRMSRLSSAPFVKAHKWTANQTAILNSMITQILLDVWVVTTWLNYTVHMKYNKWEQNYYILI